MKFYDLKNVSSFFFKNFRSSSKLLMDLAPSSHDSRTLVYSSLKYLYLFLSLLYLFWISPDPVALLSFSIGFYFTPSFLVSGSASVFWDFPIFGDSE